MLLPVVWRSYARISRSEANHCWPSTSLVLLAPFVWLMSECDALSIVPLSEPHTPSTLPMSNSQEVMSYSEITLTLGKGVASETDSVSTLLFIYCIVS